MFEELYSVITNESLNTFIDQERKLMLYQPYYLILEDKWKIIPYSDDAEDMNEFYNVFKTGIEGTKEECLELIKDYKS